MGMWELFLTAVGLSMDAFAVSICKGLSAGKARMRQILTAGFFFGVAQALMPLIGYLLGVRFQSFIVNIDHWIAFVLLSIIGAKMIYDALKGEEGQDACFSLRVMFPLAIATSIDALAIGVSFAFLKVKIIPAVVFIGVVTFLLSAIGVGVGSKLGAKFSTRAQIFGGAVLILMGLKILLEHLGVFG